MRTVYRVQNLETKEYVGKTYATRRAARLAAHRLDQKHGGVRHASAEVSVPDAISDYKVATVYRIFDLWEMKFIDGLDNEEFSWSFKAAARLNKLFMGLGPARFVVSTRTKAVQRG